MEETSTEDSAAVPGKPSDEASTEAAAKVPAKVIVNSAAGESEAKSTFGLARPEPPAAPLASFYASPRTTASAPAEQNSVKEKSHPDEPKAIREAGRAKPAPENESR
ncbi:MAG TPA: hypothetical protein VJO53_14755, partial [Candidatus Acidoferrales bacterium]|nr:hypothetical protein [Candidatus Acidoferrales bacterium]